MGPADIRLLCRMRLSNAFCQSTGPTRQTVNHWGHAVVISGHNAHGKSSCFQLLRCLGRCLALNNPQHSISL